MSGSYAGDVTPTECWNILSQNPQAQIVDVRTNVEWAFVGVPTLQSIGKNVINLQWQQFPTMEVDGNFIAALSEQLEKMSVDQDAPIYFLCRSGARSMAAAIALTAAGYSKAYNVSSGFEGNLDQQGHRGGVDGWKAEGLPWVQT